MLVSGRLYRLGGVVGQAQYLRCLCRDQGGFIVDTDNGGQGKIAAVEFDLADAPFHIVEIQGHGAAFRILFEHLTSVGPHGHVDVKAFSCMQEIADAV